MPAVVELLGCDFERCVTHESVVLVAPTSHSARAASFRPEIELLNETSRVLVEQVGALDTGRLGDLVGRVTPEEQERYTFAPATPSAPVRKAGMT
jgi:hypothetical protein